MTCWQVRKRRNYRSGVNMIRISKRTRLHPEKIIAKAEHFFGEKGLGLVSEERTPCCISFAGSGGYVTVTVVEEKTTRTVDVESREFDYQARQFLQLL